MGFFAIWTEENGLFIKWALCPFFVCAWQNLMASIQEYLTDLLDPVVRSLSCELWGIEYSGQGRRAMLRIFIDKEGGVGVEDCEKVSRQVASVLDVEDPIKAEYTLEVSSPGMDRPLFKLDQYQRNLGQKLSVRLRVAFEGRRKFTGILKNIENDEIVLEVDDEEYLLPFELIDKANIVPQF